MIAGHRLPGASSFAAVTPDKRREAEERTLTLKRKIAVIEETAYALTEVIEADRSTRLEATIILLIPAEIMLTLVQMFFFRH